MRAKRTLGRARGAAGVKERRLVVGLNFNCRQVLVRQVGIVARRPDQRLQRLGLLERRLRPRYPDGGEVGQRIAQRRDPLIALTIADQQPRARIVEAITQLLRLPPGIERHGDRAYAGDGEEGDRPFGQVAHRDGDAIALPHALLLQPMRQRGDGAEPAFIADPVVFIDDELIAGKRCARMTRQRSQAGRLVFPCAHSDAPDRHLLQLEQRSRRAQPLYRFGQRQSGPGLHPGFSQRRACRIISIHLAYSYLRFVFP